MKTLKAKGVREARTGVLIIAYFIFQMKDVIKV